MSRPLQAVLDTNVIVSISRAPAAPPNDELTKAIEGRKLQVHVDAARGIIDEWEKTAKRDVVQQLLIDWQQFKGWRLVDLVETLPGDVSRALRRLAFTDTVDKLILRTAYNTDDKRVVSNDPDFWDPKQKKSYGDANAPVATLCRERLGVTVSTLQATVDELGDRTPRARRRR
jgi:hypothetical protein